MAITQLPVQLQGQAPEPVSSQESSISSPHSRCPKSPSNVHYWVIVPPDGRPEIPGTCIHCGETRQFFVAHQITAYEAKDYSCTPRFLGITKVW